MRLFIKVDTPTVADCELVDSQLLRDTYGGTQGGSWLILLYIDFRGYLLLRHAYSGALLFAFKSYAGPYQSCLLSSDS